MSVRKMGIFDFIKKNQKIVVAALLVLAVPSYLRARATVQGAHSVNSALSTPAITPRSMPLRI